MATAVGVRGDYAAAQLRALAKRSEDANQTRRLLALADHRAAHTTAMITVTKIERAIKIIPSGASQNRDKQAGQILNGEPNAARPVPSQDSRGRARGGGQHIRKFVRER